MANSNRNTTATMDDETGRPKEAIPWSGEADAGHEADHASTSQTTTSSRAAPFAAAPTAATTADNNGDGGEIQNGVYNGGG
jgi:hypothetical protein